jgi:gluconokinase
MIIVVMGVAGAGKTTVGRALAEKLGCEFLDADSLHSAANIAKMRSGIPLTDVDRWPWLNAVARAIDEFILSGRSAVVACSALKQKYRNVLARPEVKLVYLKIDSALAQERARVRHHEFMPATLVESQFAELEEPKAALVVSAALPLEQAVEQIRNALKTSAP